MLKFYNTLSRKKEVFEPLKNKKVPLWETHWYQLRDNELLKLKGNQLRELIKLAINKAGNLNKLSKSIGMCYTDFWLVLKDRAKLVSVKKLKRLASYLGIEYSYFNDKISEIRKCRIVSIKNPKFPFNLATKEGAAILGNIVSDGCIYIDRKARNVKRTKYAAGTREEEERFINNINKVFGKVYFQKEKIRNCVYLKIGSSIIGEGLCKVGAPVGNKTEIDPTVPWLIKDGAKELKTAYLKAIFDDEGCVAEKNKSPYLTLSRSVHINSRVTSEQERILKRLKPHMKERKFPTGHKVKSIEISKIKKIKGKNSLFILLSKIRPRLLLEEADLLSSFGIRNWIRNATLSLTGNGKYSIRSELRICRKEDIFKFYKNINFGLSNKKEKLKKIIFDKK